MNTKDVASKIQELMAEGKTLEEALNTVMAKQPTVTVDRVSNISGLRNIEEIRKARKIAYAKISKSKSNPVAVARYKKEIEAANVQLNELIAEINAAEHPYMKALELGDTVSGAFQYFLDELSRKTEPQVEILSKGKSKKLVHDLIASTPMGDTTEYVPSVFTQVFNERVEKKDQRVIMIAKTLTLVAQVLEANKDKLKNTKGHKSNKSKTK